VAVTGLASAQQVDSAGTVQSTLVHTVHGAEAKRHLAPIMLTLQKEMASANDATSTTALEVLAHLQTQASLSKQSVYTYSTSVVKQDATQTLSPLDEPVAGSTQTISTCTPMGSYALNTSITQIYTNLDGGVMGWQTYETHTWRTSSCNTTV
jgi:hypothetical protein